MKEAKKEETKGEKPTITIRNDKRLRRYRGKPKIVLTISMKDKVHVKTELLLLPDVGAIDRSGLGSYAADILGAIYERTNRHGRPISRTITARE